MSNEEDPFELNGDEPERRDEPFDWLAPDAGADDDDQPEPDGADEKATGEKDGEGQRQGPGPGQGQGQDPFDLASGTRQAGDGGAGAAGDRRDPFAELEQARDADETPFDDVESVFEDRGIEEVDPDAVWDRLRSSHEHRTDSEERTYAEVPKHKYCEQCEYFSAPPDTSCFHEGTEILEFLDTETVRVVDCPVVAERQALGHRE